MMVIGTARSRRQLTLVALGAGVTLACAFLALQATRLGASTDLGFLWSAGKLWNAGLDAYSPAFDVVSRRLTGHVPKWELIYPPQWWAICSALGLMPFETAARAWHVFSLLCVLAATALLWRTAGRLHAPAPLWLRMLFVIVLFTHETIGATLTNGQTSLLMLLGVALIYDGAVRRSAWVAAAGLFVVMLKPNIGLPLVIVALAAPYLRKGLLLAIVASAIGCLPLLAGGIANALHVAGEFLHNMGGYNSPVGYNAPDRMTGLTWLLTGFPTPLTALLAGGVALVLILLGRRGTSAGVSGEAVWLHSTASIATFASLHNYDLTFTATPLLLLHRLERVAQVPLVAGILLIHSARRVAGALHPVDVVHVQAGIATAGGVLMLAAAIVTALRGFRTVPA